MLNSIEQLSSSLHEFEQVETNVIDSKKRWSNLKYAKHAEVLTE